MNLYTYSRHIGRDNSGEYYSAHVCLLADVSEIYQRTTCGFGGDYPTRGEAQAAADAWLAEMQDGPYAAR